MLNNDSGTKREIERKWKEEAKIKKTEKKDRKKIFEDEIVGPLLKEISKKIKESEKEKRERE